MINNLAIIFCSYFIIIFSVIGYGGIFSNILEKKKINLNFGYYGLFGLFILIIYAYLSHFFYSHSLLHNTLLIIFGLILFLIYFKKNLKDIIFCSSIFFILFIALIILKTHDDFPYYHFGYSYYLTQNPIMIGIGQFNHGFRTQSSIFYLNSLFYLPIVKFYFFHLSSLLILGFVNLILIKKLISNFKTEDFDYISFFNIFSIIFINIFFYRIGEHGTDRSAQILMFLFFTEIFIFFKEKQFSNLQLSKIFLILGMIISFKAFYILYIIMLLPIFLNLKKNKSFKNFFLLLSKNLSIYFFSFLFFLVLITNFFNTGCLIYPVNITCFNSFDWSFASSEIIQMNNWYEQWSKAGAGPNFRVDNPEQYILKFNWVNNWLDKYFFNKVSDFLLGVFATILIVVAIFFSFKRKKIVVNKNVYFLFGLLIILLFEWFYNHPALRYGGFSLISIILFIPVSFLLGSFILKASVIKKKIIFLVVLSILVFLSRNIIRLEKEIYQYQFKPFHDTSFRIVEQHFRIHNTMNNLIDNYNRCNKSELNCDKTLKTQVSKIYGRYKFTIN